MYDPLNFFLDDALNKECHGYYSLYADKLRQRQEIRQVAKFLQWCEQNNIKGEDPEAVTFFDVYPDAEEIALRQIDKQEFLQHKAEFPADEMVIFPDEINIQLAAEREAMLVEEREVERLAQQALQNGLNPSQQPLTSNLYLNQKVINKLAWYEELEMYMQMMRDNIAKSRQL